VGTMPMRVKGLALALILVGALSTTCARHAGEGLPWEDDFSDPASGWQAESDASAEVGYADGRMRIAVYWADRFAWAAAQRSFSDFHLTVEASQVSGPDDNEYGVQVRMQDRTHLYRFSISGDGYYQVSRLDGDSELLLTPEWTPSPAIHTGVATNVLEVICQGPRMTFLVNGTLLAEVEDSRYKAGDIALFAGSFHDPGDGVEIHFDNLRLTAP
jgi:hypothetical protein